jgi:uncharacterized protein (DUF849 family)
VLQAALNGARSPDEHPALPVTPEQLAADARAVVAEGARSLHFHVRDASGAESLEPADVAAALTAVRAAVPGVEISLSTGLWIAGHDRLELIARWTELPELVSINLSEPGWQELAALVTERGIGIEAGLATTADADALTASSLRPRRVLVEIDDETLEGPAAVLAAAEIDRRVDLSPRLHHGMGPATWAVLEAARGHDIRVGLEDALTLPGGEPTPGNAELVYACGLLALASSRERLD